ncbi:MAG: preprotein translocase subunit SecE [Rhodothermales bacterium]|nr:preprotein translocase subunit SecE [Rhodothermales bacterium]
MNKLKTYIDEVIKEMQKVSWPKRSELISNTMITLVATVIVSLLIFSADRVIGWVLENVYLLAG